MALFQEYEKISEEYLNLVSQILSQNSSRKIIIAGTNDRSKAENKLKKFINRKQAIILGFSDIHILEIVVMFFLIQYLFRVDLLLLKLWQRESQF